MKRAAISLAVLACVVRVGADEALEAHRRLEAEVGSAEARVTEVRNALDTLRTGAEVMTTAADLMTGRRRALPPVDAGERTVAAFHADAPETFVRTASGQGSTIAMRTVDLEGGVTYRFEAVVSARQVKPGRALKFGLRVVRPGDQVDWPSAAVSHAEGEVSFTGGRARFDYRMPHDAKAVLVYGLSSGSTGEAVFSNLRVIRTAD